MRLIFHIGAGKTGTSSIQYTLSNNDILLKKNGVWYLGLMLERTNTALFDWQRATTVIPDFYQLDQKEAETQILQILRPTIEEAKKNNVHTLIWSNESLLKMQHSFVPAFQKLQKEGIEIEILYYVRNYTSWARSAYMQWGTKDKAYEGRLKKFSEFRRAASPTFYKDIEYILQAMPDAIKIRNMSALNDVVVDFLEFSNIKIDDIEISRMNDSLSSEELLLRAVFNSKYNGKVLPKVFDNIVGREILLSKTPKEFLEDILPTENDLDKVMIDSSDDRKSLNLLLSEQGQQLLDDKNVISKNIEIDTEKILMALVDIVLGQSQKIARLQRMINEIKKKDEK